MKNKKLQEKGLATWMVLFSIGAVLVGIMIFAALFWPREKSAPEKPQAPSNAEASLPEKVQSYVGVIIEKGEGSFKIKAPAERNYLAQDKEILVKVNGQTEYTKTILPAVLPADTGEAAALIKTEKIAFADLKAGDNATVAAAENIKDKDEFIAESVQVLETEAIKSCRGEITNISADKLEISARAYDNAPLYLIDQILAVEISAKTKYYIWQIDATAQDPEKQFQKKAIQFQDLKKGDQVNIESSENLQGKDSFSAQAIYVLPQTLNRD